MKIKQLTLLLVALCLSSVVFASTQQPKWFLGGQAIYGNTGYDHSVFYTDDTKHYDAGLDAEWGFKTWVGYDAGNGISYWLDWFRFYNAGKTSIAPLPGLLSLFTGDLSARQASDIDQITLQMAHTYNNNNGSTVKIHVGPQLLLLDVTKTIDLFVADSVFEIPITLGVNTNERSEFGGGGVVAGIDLEHNFGNSFSIFSRNQVGLAYGKLDNEYKLDVAIWGDFINLFGDAASMQTQRKYTVLPTLNAELGVAYNLQLANLGLRFEAGVRGFVVIDGVQNLSGEFLALGPVERYNWIEASIFFGSQVVLMN